MAARCDKHIWDQDFNDYCPACEAERYSYIKENPVMTRNADLGNAVTYDKNNSRTILKTDSVVDSIIDQFVSRAQFGKDKYKTDLDRNDLSVPDWIEHAQQELMDGILYLEKLKQVLSGKK